MPRNRKRRPPAEPIDVRIDEAGSLSCGRCGQAFPSIIFNERIAAHVMSWDDEGFETRQITPEIETRVSDGQSAPWLATMSITAWGWRFDGEAWRPTSESHSEWAQANKVMQRPDLYSEKDITRAKSVLSRGTSAYTDKNREQKLEIPSITAAQEIAQRFTLPTKIECIQCSMLNMVTSG
jgi:hypothetical protein